MKMRGLMRWLFLCAALAAACDTSTTTGSDFGVELPGCRGPSQCWNLHCPCVFGTVDECMVCDPNSQPGGVCTCSNFDQDGMIEVACMERAQVCVGRGPSTCNGKCVHPTPDMAANQNLVAICQLDGDPPQEVASVVGADGGPAIERRCEYADDICCE
jgi:hypothetical protein